MKKIICVLVLAVLCTSCGKPPLQESQPAPAPSVSASATDNAASAGKTIVPLPSTLEIDSIADATVSASFELKDLVTASTGSHSLNLTVYDYELFDLVDISTLAVGDTIVVAKENIRVEALEKTDGGLILINGGVENGGVELYTNNNTVYFETGMDGFNHFFEVGQATLDFSDSFKFVDNSNLEKLNQEFAYDAFAEKLKDGQISFNQFNTTVLIQNKEITEITLSFLP